MSYLKSVGTAIIYVGLFLAVLTFVPGLPPETEFKEYSVTPPRDVKIEYRLNGAEKLFDGEVLGPEGFASYDGQLYTGIHGGYIVRLDKDRIVPIVRFGKKCDGIWQEHICGRPLGLNFDKKGNLFVADAYYGIFKVNVKTKTYENIVDPSKPIDGKISQITNSIAVAENGDLYWTVSSTDYALCDLIQTLLGNPSGRLIRYNAAKKENEVLMQDLAFANGVVLSEDESFVIVAETTKNRIMKYNLKGPKAGQQEIFIEGLPGSPDNLQSDGQGGFLFTAIIVVDSEHPQLTQSLAPHPYLRKMLLRLFFAIELPFKLLHDIYPNTYTEKVLHAVGAYQSISFFFESTESLIFRVDASGNIMEVLSSNDGMIYGVSEAHIHDGYVWFGSPWRHYVAQIPLKQAFPDLADKEKQSSRAKRSAKQPLDAGASDVKSEKAETAKPKKAQTRPSDAPTTSKPTPAPTTTPKPTAASKPTAVPKVDKPATTGSGGAKPSETKSTSKPTNAEVKDGAKTVNDAKPDTKSSSNAKPETNSRKEDAAKTSTKSGKSVKMEEDVSVKHKEQKPQSERVKKVETNRPTDEL